MQLLNPWQRGLLMLCLSVTFLGFIFSKMKLKEIDRTAIQAWSPAQQHPIYLATGEFLESIC